MTDTDDEFTPPAPHARYRWPKRVAKWLGGALAVLALVVFVSRWQVGRLGERDLTVTVNRLDDAEPGWRLDAIMAERDRRPEPPADENANARVLALADQVPKEWNDWQVEAGKTDWSRTHPDNHRPGAEALAAAAKMAGPTRDLRARALDVRNLRPGRYPLVVAQDPIATTLPHLDSARRVVALLEFDANWETLHENPNRGIAAARAELAVARSIGDEPLLVSQLVRLACASNAARTALQTLAWGEPTEGLAELQAELLAEADVPWFQLGMRGERAVLDRVFEGLENGTIPWENCFHYANVGKPGPEHYAAFRAYKSLLPGDRAMCLRLCTQYVEASKLAPQAQHAAVKQVEVPKGPPDEFRYLITRLMLPACEQIAESGLRARADLLSAAVAVACERYRRKNGRFPFQLVDLFPEFLSPIPSNPFNGLSPAYHGSPDRVAIYFYWGTGPKVGHLPEDFHLGNAPGTAVGARLWLPKHRGHPPQKQLAEGPQP